MTEKETEITVGITRWIHKSTVIIREGKEREKEREGRKRGKEGKKRGKNGGREEMREGVYRKGVM